MRRFRPSFSPVAPLPKLLAASPVGAPHRKGFEVQSGGQHARGTLYNPLEGGDESWLFHFQQPN